MTLNSEQQKLIEQMVEAGLYKSADEAIDAAISRKLEALREDAQVGLDQLEHGEYTGYTGESLHELFDDVKRRGRERRSQNPAHPD